MSFVLESFPKKRSPQSRKYIIVKLKEVDKKKKLKPFVLCSVFRVILPALAIIGVIAYKFVASPHSN